MKFSFENRLQISASSGNSILPFKQLHVYLTMLPYCFLRSISSYFSFKTVLRHDKRLFWTIYHKLNDKLPVSLLPEMLSCDILTRSGTFSHLETIVSCIERWLTEMVINVQRRRRRICHDS